MSLTYTMMLKNKNDNNKHRMEKDKDNNTKGTKNGTSTRPGRKRKRTSEEIQRISKRRYKKGNGDSSDDENSESERDYDYVPSESGSSTESDSDSESNDSEYEKVKNSKTTSSKRPIRTSTRNKNYKESDTGESTDDSDTEKKKYSDLEKDAEKEYEKYMEKLAEEMGDNIYNQVKSKLTDSKVEEDNTNDKMDDNSKKGTIGHIIILSQSSSSSSDKNKKGYNLRTPVDQDILSIEDKKQIEDTEKALFELNRHKIPPRHKILLSHMTLASKAKIIGNMDRLNTMNSYSSEYSKLTRWLDNILRVPFGKFNELPVTLSSSNSEITSYLNNIETTMDECIYGQRTAKEKILEFVGKWITNPKSTNEPLAFIGEKGTGKTTLAKEGIAKALGRPFYMISLGGESDAASFKGHDYTYEGSRWGRIVDILIATQCMNPVIFFDELDKLSTTRAGEEIAGMLMHLTDTTQNDRFSDKYFSGIDFDLSKAMFIFSYNDPHKLNPILRDRLTEIKFKSFKKNDKVIIAKKFLIKRACENIGLKYDDYIFPEDTITTLIERYTANEESGVRSLKRIIETLFLRINLYQLPQTLNISYRNLKMKQTGGKYKIGERVVSELLKDMIPVMSQAVLSMYT
jgi:ATP-dependent Lon protease